MTDTFEAARAHFRQGVALFEAGDAAGAEQALRASLALLPGRPSTLVNLGAVLLRLGRAAEAMAALDEALATDEQQADAWCHRALACCALGRDSEALADLQRAGTGLHLAGPAPPARAGAEPPGPPRRSAGGAGKLVAGRARPR